MIIFSAFSRLGHFPQVFGQAKECFILQLHEMIRVLHAVAYQLFLVCFTINNGNEVL